MKRANVSVAIFALLVIFTLSTFEMGIQAISPFSLVSIYLDSEEIDGSTSNLGTITFDPEPYPGYSLPTTIQRDTAPFYQAAYYPPSRHVIDHWELSGGIHLVPPQNDPNSPLISVEVTGSGTMTAVYIEIFDVNLESIEDNGATSNLGSIALPSSGTSYSLPRLVNREWGTYEATYYPDSGYGFDSWETSGGVGVPDPYVGPTTSVTITGDGTLRAVYTQSGAPPSPPLDLTAIPLLGGINLTWQEPVDQGSSAIVEYKIYRGNSLGGEIYHHSVFEPAPLYHIDTLTDDDLYYYYVTAVNDDGYESPPSNRVKSARLISLKGIQSTVHLNALHTNNDQEFSIQQNFWIWGDDQRLWAQNIIVVKPRVNKMHAVFELWDHVNLDIFGRPSRLIAYWHATSPDYDLTNDLTFHSVIDSNTLVMTNNFAEIDHSLAANSYISEGQTSALQIEIVLVGPWSLGLPLISPSTVEFLPTTEGHIDNFVRIGTDTWLHGGNAILESGESTSTGEDSTGLRFDHPSLGDFESALTWTDQGYRFEPDYSRDIASPPEPPDPLYTFRIAVETHCPVNLHLFDDLGRHLGFNSSSGLFDYEIPNATIQVSEEAQCAVVFDAEGYYRIWIEGTDEGNYTVTEYAANSTASFTLIGNYTGSVANGSSTSYGLSITNGTASSGIPGDINLDGKTDTEDLSFIAARFGLDSSNPSWNATADLFPDSIIDVRDLFSTAAHYGEMLENTLFEDDFEAYAVDTFPSAGGWELVFTGKGSPYQIVTSVVSNSPTRSFQLWGSSGTSANVQKKFTSSADTIGYEVYVRTESLTGTLNQVAQVCFWNRSGLTWGKKFARIDFLDNGEVYMCPVSGVSGVPVTTFEPNRWYRVRTIVDQAAGTFDVWIDDVHIVQDEDIWDTHEIEALQLQCGHAGIKAYFDDVKIFESP